MAAQYSPDIKEIVLRAMLVRVMAHQQEAARIGAIDARYGASRRIEVGGAVMLVGLEIGGFRPFVPGVDADKGLAKKRLQRAVGDQAGQPILVFLRCRPVDDHSGPLLPGVVIPAWDYGADQRKAGLGLGQRGVDDVVVQVGCAGKLRIEKAELALDPGQPFAKLVRRKLDRPVKTVNPWVEIAKALRHDDDRLLAEPLGENAAPLGKPLGRR